MNHNVLSKRTKDGKLMEKIILTTRGWRLITATFVLCAVGNAVGSQSTLMQSRRRYPA